MTLNNMKVFIIFGTRPEAIKMAPVIAELKRHPNAFNVFVVATGQHREMLDQVLSLFKIQLDYNLDIMQPKQSLAQITNRILQRLDNILEKESPDIILVQGDTTTTFTSALVAFYRQIPIGHIEAGLRTHNKYNPFPEEINRHLTTALANLHFAPTQMAKENLLREGVPPETIYVTGNTVVDSLFTILQQDSEPVSSLFASFELDHKKIILVTAHRRENWGKPLESICLALKELIQRNKEIKVVFSVHPNPIVNQTVHNILGNIDRSILIEPLDYFSFVHLINKSHIILTDSGGIQEEAPSLGKPVLLMRETTERPEGIELGLIKLVGTDKNRLIEETELLLNNQEEYKRMVSKPNPFGDGNASQRIAEVLKKNVFSKHIGILR
jgi:UDP-N-acetylglucosamine 2-epimerase (non-hydrolysing)